jgi:hypothetical protein
LHRANTDLARVSQTDFLIPILKQSHSGAVQKLVPYLIRDVQMQGAQETELRGVYLHTLSGAVCSATQQMSVFQQPYFLLFFD